MHPVVKYCSVAFVLMEIYFIHTWISYKLKIKQDMDTRFDY